MNDLQQYSTTRKLDETKMCIEGGLVKSLKVERQVLKSSIASQVAPVVPAIAGNTRDMGSISG